MIVFSSNILLLFPVAMSLFVVLKIAQGAKDSQGTSFAEYLVRGLLIAMFLFSTFAVGFRTNVLAIAWSLLVVGLLFVLYWKNRRLRRSAVLLTSMNADDLAERQFVADAFVNESHGSTRRRAKRLRRNLAIGMPWAEAVENSGIAKGVFERLALRLQARYGRKQNCDDGDSLIAQAGHIESEAERLLGRLTLFSWIILIMPAISFFLFFIVPSINNMFEEFGLQLPPAFLFVSSSSSASKFGIPILIGAIVFLLFSTLVVGMLLWMFPSFLQANPFRLLCRDYFRNVGFVALASAIEHENDLATACEDASELIPLEFLSAGYSLAGESIRKGMPLSLALHSAKILTQREQERCIVALDSHNPAWGFRQFALQRCERMLQRYSVLSQILFIVLTLVAAAVVGLFSVSFIQVLSTLILSLS